jgi:hypothetical protein
MDAVLFCAVGATVKDTVFFHAMPEDLASAVDATRRQGMDGAFETVEYMCLAIHAYFEPFIVFVSAYFAYLRMAVASKEVCD